MAEYYRGSWVAMLAEFNLAYMHVLIHFSLAFDFLKQDVPRVFLNVVVVGFVPVLTAQLTSTLLSCVYPCGDLTAFYSKTGQLTHGHEPRESFQGTLIKLKKANALHIV